MINRALLTLVLSLATNLAIAGLDNNDATRLTSVLAAQSDAIQTRYPSRHPQETLQFFGIKPGMTVIEVLPGSGWYSPILVAYLGSQGQLIGADYDLALWPNFPFADDKFMAQKQAWVEKFPADAKAWQGDDGASVTATRLGSMDAALDGTVDAVLFVRAFHNLYRFESKGGFRSTAMADAYRVLKPGGIVGVVQHEAPADRAVSWADGSRGYLNRAVLIADMKAAGFEFVGGSDVNANPRDVPSEEEIVWRLPPSLMTSRDNTELKVKYETIGESNRMTLLFQKSTRSH
jgi:predicted methyltransferase